jgi:hypothetical protein
MIGLKGIGDLFGAAGKVVDAVHTSDEEKLILKNEFFTLQGSVLSDVLEYQQSLNELQSKVIIAESQSASWITRNWRPVTMLNFVGLITLRWLGLSAPGITEALELELLSIVKYGLSGYVVGRSAEQIVKVGAQALKDYKK